MAYITQLTDTVKQAYMKRPLYCPMCQSVRVETDKTVESHYTCFAIPHEKVIRYRYCPDCKFEWVEHLELTDIVEIIEVDGQLT